MKSKNLDLSGEFVVAVGNCLVMNVTEVEEAAEIAPVLFAKGNDVYKVVHDSDSQHGVEHVHADESMVDSFVEIMYMSQRSSTSSEWSNLPPATSEVYDALVYTQSKIRAEGGMKSYQDAIDEMSEQDRFEEEPPEWVTEALD